MRERSLVAFTLLAQTAVGAFLTLCALDLWAEQLPGVPAALVVPDRGFLAVAGLMGAALLVSLLHLGTPRSAWRAVANLRASWLSREVLSALLFAGCAALVAAHRWTGAPGAAVLGAALRIFAAASGVGLLLAMAGVYRLRTVPAWDTPWTVVSFCATASLLGALPVGAALGLAPALPADLAAGPLKWIAAAGAAGFVAEIAGALGARRGPGALSRPAARTVRLVLLAAGLVLCLPAILGLAPAAACVAGAWCAALAAQVQGRYTFYAEGLRRTL